MKDNAVVKEAKEKITKRRLQISEIKAETGKLEPKSITVKPQDLKIMAIGQMAMNLMESKKQDILRLKAIFRDYLAFEKEDAESIVESLVKKFDEEDQTNFVEALKETGIPEGYIMPIQEIIESFIENQRAFTKAKKLLEKKSAEHPLWDRMKDIRGFTSYQLGILMSFMKKPDRFENPGKLAMWAGIASVDGKALTKATINSTKEYYSKHKLKEFKGYCTEIQGRLLGVSVPAFLKNGGWFYEHYLTLRARLAERANNDGMTEMKGEKIYMKDKKNMSLIQWTHKNAMRRVARILLHFIWNEWMALNGLPGRLPYAIEYLGHTSLITLDEVLEFDRNVKASKKTKK